MNSYSLREKPAGNFTSRHTRNFLHATGALLKEVREKRYLTIRDIRDRTCIPVHHVIAIENGYREKLPEDLFLIGFLKRYAKAVGLDEYLICEMYLKGNGLRNPDEGKNAFDLLFEDKEDVQKEKEIRPLVKGEKNILRVYHFYFFIGIVFCFVLCYLVCHFNLIRERDWESVSFVETKAEELNKPDKLNQKINISKSSLIVLEENNSSPKLKLKLKPKEAPVKAYNQIVRDINELMLRPMKEVN